MLANQGTSQLSDAKEIVQGVGRAPMSPETMEMVLPVLAQGTSQLSNAKETVQRFGRAPMSP